jgi:uncharacterized membrane protein
VTKNSRSLPAAVPQPDFDRRFIAVSVAILVIVIAFFTWLHYGHPEILRVPGNTDLSGWQNPALEQTIVYQNATEAARARLKEQGVPGNTAGALVFLELSSIFVALLCFWHARKHHGLWMAWCFLIGSFAFTGLQESMWILYGRFTGMSAMQGIGEEVFGTYWFTKGGTWFIETPVAICLGWFYVAYGCVWMAGRAFPRSGLYTRAAIGGLAGMIVDLWQDPINTAAETMSWVWASGDFIRIFGIPQSNFLGWFLLIFVFAVLWEHLPEWEQRWGRAKATGAFLGALIAADFGILLFQYPWCFVLRGILVAAGVEHTVHLPAGW